MGASHKCSSHGSEPTLSWAVPGSQVSHLASAPAGKVVGLAASWVGKEETSCYTQMQSLSAKDWERGWVRAAVWFWWLNLWGDVQGHVPRLDTWALQQFFSHEQRCLCALCWLAGPDFPLKELHPWATFLALWILPTLLNQNSGLCGYALIFVNLITCSLMQRELGACRDVRSLSWFIRQMRACAILSPTCFSPTLWSNGEPGGHHWAYSYQALSGSSSIPCPKAICTT